MSVLPTGTVIGSNEKIFTTTMDLGTQAEISIIKLKVKALFFSVGIML